MSRMIASEGMTDAEAFEQLGKTMMVEPLDVSPEYHRPLMTTANIIGIAEQRRDPYMGLSSAQTIDHASDPESGLSPADVFGKERKKSKGNDPGMLPASGTGAKEEFSEMRADLEQGHDPSTPAGQRISGNIAKQHLALMRKGFNSEQAQKLLQRGYDRSFVQEAMLARMRSSATRTAAKMTGQLPYNLRSLRRTREDAKDAVKSGRVGKKGKGRK
jgi:hypothetical protein